MPHASNCEKLKILLWKNWLIEKAHKKRIVCYYILPLLFVMLLQFTRSVDMPEKKPELHFQPVNITNLNLLKDMWTYSNLLHFGVQQPINFEILYSPKNTFLDRIMRDVANALNVENSEGYMNAYELEKALMKSNLFAGVEFDERLRHISEIPKWLKYSLRFPMELRAMYEDEKLATWHTQMMHPDVMAPRNVKHDDGGSPDGYIREGFIALQNAVAIAYLNAASDAVEFPLIQMQRFPYPPHTEDPIGLITHELYFTVLILTYLIPCVKITAFLTEERQTRLKEFMKIMGIQGWLHWMAWFLKSVLILALMSLAILFIVKLQFSGSSVAVLNESNALILYIFYFTYIMAAVSFAMLVSVCFNKVSTAVIALVIMWFLSVVPMHFEKTKSSLFAGLVSCLSFNTAFGVGNRMVVIYELEGQGLQWYNLFTPATIHESLSVGLVMLMLLVTTILYMLIGMYVEQVAPGEFGTPKPWNFFCKIPSSAQESFDRSIEFQLEDFIVSDISHVTTAQSFTRQREGIFEVENSEKPVGVQLLGLTKVYAGKPVVRNLRMNLYKDEITVLLGHNGAGKTTTVSMLSGMVPPTVGTAIVNGWDIRENIDEVRQSLSICPQYNTLFDEISVRNHIEFFSRLRGSRGSELTDEIEKYLKVTGLKSQEHNPSKTLSGGMKRNLSVCCALCGKVSVVLFDEPSSGLDTGARRQLWDILQAEKTDRTFLLTTHYMDEAEVLGDRIAIMNDGKLKCYGTSFFLKQKYGTGYQLICEKGENCDAEEVTGLLRTFIPSISVKSDTSTELVYTLQDSNQSVFSGMFKELEDKLQELDLKGFGVTASSLEDVFMTVGADRTRESHISRETDHSELTLDNEQGYIFSPVEGLALYCNHWRAMLMKSTLYTIRRFSMYALQIFMIVIALIWVYNDVEVVRPLEKIDSLPIDLQYYKSAVTLLEVEPSVANGSTEFQVAAQYVKIISSLGPMYTHQATGSENVSTFLLEKGSSARGQSEVNKQYLVAATIGKNKIICWFNNWWYHTAPLSLNLIHNALARVMIDKSAEIIVVNAPLPFKPQSVMRIQDEGITLGKTFAYTFSVVMCFVTSYFIMVLIKERQCNFKLMQHIGGLGVYTYWFSRYAWDMVTYILMVLVTLILLYFFRVDDFSSYKHFVRYFVVFFIFGLSFLPFIYIVSLFFNKPFEGYMHLSLINLLIIIVLIILDTLKAYEVAGLDIIKYIGPIFPLFSLNSALLLLSDNYVIRRVCSRSFLTPQMKCDTMPECCEIKGYYDWREPGILKYLVYLILVGVFCLVLLFMLELFLLDAVRRLWELPKSRRKLMKDLDQDLDVKAEEDLIRNMTSEDRDKHNLVVDTVSKFYGSYLAVNQISLCIKPYECFGLLGMNGAGKTTTFQMMVGELAPTAGHIYLRGGDFRFNRRYVYQLIGYCPQSDALPEELTARETLHMFLLMNGVHDRLANEKAEDLADTYGFLSYMDKPVMALSGGCKRKLSMVIASIGNPSLMFLDEPTTGMDPASRRQIRTILSNQRNAGNSLVLTTHNMDDIEAICTRLTIMVNGEFKCIGSVQHLKSKFSKGLILKIKLKRIDDVVDHNVSIRSFKDPPRVNSIELLHNINALKDFIGLQIPAAELQDEYRFLLTYTIPMGTMQYSEIFNLMESNRLELKIEDYYISQTSLEEVFLQFARSQRRSARYSVRRAKSLTRVAG